MCAGIHVVTRRYAWSQWFDVDVVYSSETRDLDSSSYLMTSSKHPDGFSPAGFYISGVNLPLWILITETATVNSQIKRFSSNYYLGPHTWALRFPAAAGKRQSPINLNTKSMVFDRTLKPLIVNFDAVVKETAEVKAHNFHVKVEGKGGQFLMFITHFCNILIMEFLTYQIKVKVSRRGCRKGTSRF